MDKQRWMICVAVVTVIIVAAFVSTRAGAAASLGPGPAMAAMPGAPAQMSSFGAAACTTREAAGSATITVTLDAIPAVTATVAYATSDGTAETGSDYLSANGLLTLAPGVTTRTFAVSILDDLLEEPDRTVALALDNPSGATLGAPAAATLTILDDDTYLYMPWVVRKWPPTPDTPMLYAILNSDGDGNYVVSWSSAALAQSYTLERATNAGFSGAVVVYQGPATAHGESGRPPRTYYYRVRAHNGPWSSAWSNTQSTMVWPSTIYASADTMIWQNYPTANTCDTWDMWAGYDGYLDGGIVRSLVQFDLSGISAGAPIAQAELYVKLYAYWDYPDTWRTITTRRVGSGWSACEVTWNTQPTLAEAYGFRSVGQDLGGWYAFDVTDLVRGWVNGNFANFGLWLVGPEISGSDSSFRGFYTENSPLAPYLSIDYGGAGVTEVRSLAALSSASSMVAPSVLDRIDVPARGEVCAGEQVAGRRCLEVVP